MKDTRVKILADLERWASDDASSRVCWLSGLAGVGKSSIALTFSERLDNKLKLGGSCFCHHSSDARLIVPSLAHMLARISPPIRSEICQVLQNNPDVVSDSLSEQFRSLVVLPVQRVFPNPAKTYQIVVIDAIDECSDQSIVESLIGVILACALDLPLKFFIASRPEPRIRKAFRNNATPSSNIKVFDEIHLHEATKDDVRNDIQTYLQRSLSDIAVNDGVSQHPSDWPPENEFQELLKHCEDLFIYAATAVRYIGAENGDYRERLTNMTRNGSAFATKPNDTINSLYQHIMDRAFSNVEVSERSRRIDVLAAVVCLQQSSLTMDAIASLLALDWRDVQFALLPLYSVINVTGDGQIGVFHSSFRDFLVNPVRRGGTWVDASEAHRKLTVGCLECLHKSLRRNICKLPDGPIASEPHEIKNVGSISEVLRYSCLHWASHLSLAGKPLAESTKVPALLSKFAERCLLFWFECLSAMGELESGLKSLNIAREAISVSTLPEGRKIPN